MSNVVFKLTNIDIAICSGFFAMAMLFANHEIARVLISIFVSHLSRTVLEVILPFAFVPPAICSDFYAIATPFVHMNVATVLISIC